LPSQPLIALDEFFYTIGAAGAQGEY
jgi:hypothetical protein